MLGGQVFGAPDALLPACVGHRAIMGLPASASNCSVLEGYSVKYSSSRHWLGFVGGVIVLTNLGPRSALWGRVWLATIWVRGSGFR